MLRREVVAPAFAWAAALLVAVPVLVTLNAPRAWGDDLPAQAFPALTYEPFRGVEIGGTGLSLGGYVNAEVEKPEGEQPSFLLEEVALLVNWNPSPYWHFFSETELEDLLEVDGRGVRSNHDDLVVQKRLYLDYTWSDRLTVRVGKFLTPVGIWNVIHAAPLVWTVSRPLATTTLFFDDATTGVMLFGGKHVGGLRVDYSLYGQPTDQLLAEDDDESSASRAAGTRLQFSNGGPWSVGVSSLAQDNQVLQQWEYIGGTDFRLQRDRVELWNELTVKTPVHGGEGTEVGLYTQAAVRVVGDFYAIGRYEYGHIEEDVNAWVIGLDYRPWPNWVVKTQYVFSDGRSEAEEPGFAAALAMFF